MKWLSARLRLGMSVGNRDNWMVRTGSNLASVIARPK